MRIYIICSVRNATAEQKKELEYYAKDLKYDGHTVHLPHRDTNQNSSGLEICKQNLEATKLADEIHIFYDKDSQGSHFDIGMAFALDKKIKVVKNGYIEEGKCFPRMLWEWTNDGFKGRELEGFCE